MKYLPLFSLLIICNGILIGQNKLNTLLDEVLHHDQNHGHFHFHFNINNAKIEKIDQILNIYLDIDEALDPFNNDLENLYETFTPLLVESKSQDLKIFVKGKNDIDHKLLSEFIGYTETPKYIRPKNTDPFKNKSPISRNINPTNSQGQSIGALTGKTVWLSPGHGYMDDDGNGTWNTQRGNTNGMVEDFGSIGGVNYFLQRYLKNAGADVWIVRERDINTEEIIIDNDNGLPEYDETGTWSTSGSTGYNGGTYRFANSDIAETATAIFRPNITKSGWYWVSTYFREGANRVSNLKYKINHAGGETVVEVNQEVHGQTWKYIGEFYFDVGTDGYVEISNETNESGQAVIADAVRFGGGIGAEGDCSHGGTGSGYPRFDEAARQYAMYQGYPTCTGDVTIRPKYAEWELSKGTSTEQANAVYLAWHTNAVNGSVRGTETFSYNGAGSNPVITPGSIDLRNFVHNELIDYIHTFWDAGWSDRGVKTANFGELRELSTMPGALVEIAFHDNIDDANALKTPYFRDLAARALYSGILKFFNDRDGTPLIKTPNIPTHVSAINEGDNSIRVTWNNSISDASYDPADGYMVYKSTHGYGFEDGIATTGNSLLLTNLIPGETYYFQVAATNAGGESFPTSTVACRLPTNGSYIKYLIVDGFDRLDRSSSVKQNNDPNLGTVDRMFLEQMNRYDYMVDHAKALESCNYHFDGMQNEAVLSQTDLINKYKGIDWILGEESTVDNSLDVNEQATIMQYLDDGGNLIISGAEIGWDLGRSSSPNASLAFYNNYLKSIYAGDDGNTYSFSGVVGTDFSGLSGSFDDGANGYYNVAFPDRISPNGGSSVIFNYSGGSSDGAAIAYKGSDFGVINFGFPLESIYDENLKQNIFCTALNFLTPNECQNYLFIDNAYDQTVSTMNASIQIDSDRNIFTNLNSEYFGGSEVNLLPGFEISLGSMFLADIAPCP